MIPNRFRFRDSPIFHITALQIPIKMELTCDRFIHDGKHRTVEPNEWLVVDVDSVEVYDDELFRKTFEIDW